ncbi:MAG: hypothetical protein QM741_02445 [Rudaea sp.]|uniref:hypothetical protein n=1 Tax=Rudaea sp. TaxID=2136325 RepID=UPI0039E5603D
MLLDDVFCHGEKIRLGRTDGLDVRDAEHAQVDFLDEVGQVARVAHAGDEKPPELVSVRDEEVRHQRLRILGPQHRTPD